MLSNRGRSWTATLLAAVTLVAGLAVNAPLFAQTAPNENSLAPATAAAPAVEAAPPTATRTLLSIIRDGGIVMFPLLSCSFVLTVFLFERAISLRRGRVIPGPFVKRFIHQLRDGQLDRDQAVALCDGNGSPVSKVFLAAVKKWGKPAAQIDQAINDAGQRLSNDLRRYLRVFNGLATVTPLLGLLGTVFGIIRSFNDIARGDGMGKAEMLAKGISEALFATATGLSIAIPSLVLYWVFVGKCDRLTMDVDALGQDVVNVISEEAIQDGSAAKPSKTRRSAAAAA